MFYSKHVWVILLKDRKFITTTYDFLNGSNHKTNKMFYNRSMKSWLEDNSIEMYLTHYIGKSVAAERFIIILKNNICKYTTSI